MWHLPYAMIGGVETLYATILKYMDSTFEHYVTCHTGISEWARFKFSGIAKLCFFTDPLSLCNAIKTINPDLIVGTHGMTLYHSLDYMKAKIPIVEVVHGSHIWVEHNVSMPKRWTQHVVCVSDTAQEVYLRNSNFNIPTSVIINGVDTQVFYPRKPFSKTVKVYAYFGRLLEGDKKITKIITAFRALGNQHTKLYLIGGKGAEVVSLKRLVKSLNIASSVVFHDHCDDPEKYYKEIDICTVRSEAEGYCNSAAESLASGVPLVCYNFGGILRHVEEGTILVANSQQEYCEHLGRLYKDAELRRVMRDKGLKFVQQKGNARLTAIEYSDLFSKLLRQPFVVKELPAQVTSLSLPGVGKVKISDSRPIIGVSTPHWHGIHTATQGIADIIVPWERSPKKLAQRIARSNPRAVLFSGLPEGFDETAIELNTKYSKIPLFCYYHGGYSHYSFASGLYGEGERRALLKIIELHKAGVFKKIAVSSPGMEQVCLKNRILAQFCGNVFKGDFTKVQPADGVHIGNWNRHHDHKHTSIGVAAGNLISESKVHMLSCPYRVPSLDYDNVYFYSEMPQQELYTHYQKMTVNLQLSFIETFNISVLEMWALGTPVIVGPGNRVLVESNSYLLKNSYVDDHTNPVAVAKAINFAIQNRDQMVDISQEHLKKLNEQTLARWKEFFL